MRHVKILDCTLRDGGYLVDTRFGDRVIKGIIKKLYQSRIDIIEVGFLKDIGHEVGSTIFKNAEEIIQYLPEDRKKDISFVAMADYGRYSIDNLQPCDGRSIDAIRNCFFKKDRFEAISFGHEIMEKGYNVYIQPVDILGYTDKELLELIEKVNELNPYAFSMVDTFGSMYNDDLKRLYSIINHNLQKNIKLDFHSHNNLQLSFSLSQELSKMSFGQREIIIDATICGMGRGAGNTNTELIVNYLNNKLGYDYDMNELLDLIDIYMPKIMKGNKWGYSIPYFIAGMYSCHVNNISYLLNKHNINSIDMRLIIEKLDSEIRKRYDYYNLENLYLNHFDRQVDDFKLLERLKEVINNRKILLIVPGKTLEDEKNNIELFIYENKPIVISVNFISNVFSSDYAFFSSIRRYQDFKDKNEDIYKDTKKILTSNIKIEPVENEIILNYSSLIKRGWEYFDNSTILLLRLLNRLSAKEIFIAGFDGFLGEENYSSNNCDLEVYRKYENNMKLNREIKEMLEDFNKTIYNEMKVQFLTNSQFSKIFNLDENDET